MEGNKEGEDKGRTVNRNKGKHKHKRARAHTHTHTHTHTQAEKGTFGIHCGFFLCTKIRYSLAS